LLKIFALPLSLHGILLALEVNNWNQSRIEQTQEAIILQQLKGEYEANLVRLKKAINEKEAKASSCRKFLDLIKDSHFDTAPRLLDSLLYIIISFEPFEPVPGVSEQLLNSDRFYIISNLRLRELLTSWPALLRDLKEDEYDQFNTLKNHFAPYLAKNFTLRNAIHKMALEATNGEVNVGLSNQLTDEDYIRLLKDAEFESWIAEINRSSNTWVVESSLTMNHIDEILILLDEKISE